MTPEIASRQPEACPQTATDLDAIEVAASETTADVNELHDTTLDSSQWAYLDQDARLATEVLLTQKRSQ